MIQPQLPQLSERVFLCIPLGCAIFRTNYFAVGIAFFAGTLAALQAVISGELTKQINDSLWAGLISNLGALSLVLFFIFSKKFRDKFTNFYKQVKFKVIPRWYLLGGLFGAIYVATSAFAVAALGAGLFTIGIVASANFTSLVVDKFGFGSLKVYAISKLRVFAALLAVIAVSLATFNNSEKIALVAIFMVLLGGVAQIFQLAFNSKLATVSSVRVATFINFPIAILVGLVVVLISHLLGTPWPQFPNQWWLYTAGLLGGSFVLIAAWLVRNLGLLIFTLATLSGQLIAALLLDLFVIGINVGWQLITGAILVLVAVYLAGELR